MENYALEKFLSETDSASSDIATQDLMEGFQKWIIRPDYPPDNPINTPGVNLLRP